MDSAGRVGREKERLMTPSATRCIRAAMLAGAICCAGEAAAQQATQAGQQAATGTAKTAPPRTETAKRKAAEKKPKADPAAAQGEVENGMNALAQGRPDAAITSLSNALAAGSLPQQQTARALYYRGVAYRRSAKPAQAISDLTNALWIKNGLTDEQRTDAMAQRSAAYRDAGLPDQAEPPAQRTAARTGAAAKEPQNATPFSGLAPPSPTSSTSLTSSAGSFFSSLFGGSTQPPAEAPRPAAASSAPAPAVQPAPTTTASLAPRQAAPPPAAAPSNAAAAASAAAQSAPASGAAQSAKPPTRLVPVHGSGSSLPTGFQDFPETVRYVEVSTQAPARAAQAAPPTAPAQPEPAAKADARSRQGPAPGAQSAAQPKVALATPKAATAAGGPAPGGPVQVQVAAVRSAAEAQSVAATLQGKFARELGGRAPVVDQLSAGSLGTIWRVQVGPFASARETEGLCARLKREGLDCRIVGHR